MTDNDSQPLWNIDDKPGSLKAYAEWLHREAVRMFMQDKSHCQILFLFSDVGLASMNPVPENTEPERLLAGVRRAVQEHNLYGVITIAEAWTYMPRRVGDHTAVQIMHGEMRVADLKDDDRTEALMLRMESRDGGHLTWLEPIIRTGDDVTLGEGVVLGCEACLKMESFFGYGR
ncbi:MAG: hypothetical protein GX565_05280 [Lentisphaerae bacterium]|nr:hypothetical protein [Lentisphaerota bacterium]